MAFPLSRTVTVSATGPSGALNMDPAEVPFSASVQVYVGAGVTTTYSLEITLDPLLNPDGTTNANVRWVTDAGFPVGSSATLIKSYTAPIYGVRLNVATLTGGNLELKTLQGIN